MLKKSTKGKIRNMEKLNNNQITYLEIARREGFKRIQRDYNKIYLYGDDKTISFPSDKNIVDLSTLDNLKMYEIEDLCIFNEIEYIGYFVEIRDYKDKVILKTYYCDTLQELLDKFLYGIDRFKKTLYIKRVTIYMDDNNQRKEYFKIIKKFDNIEDYKKYIELSD